MGVEILDAFAVDLGAPRDNVVALQQELRQHTHAAAHFEYIVGTFGRAARKRVADFARYVQIGQEVLAERLFGSYLVHLAVLLRLQS